MRETRGERDVRVACGLDTGAEADMRQESERECHRVKAEKVTCSICTFAELNLMRDIWMRI